MKKSKLIAALLSIALLCSLITACGEDLSGRSDSTRKLSEEDAKTELEALLTKVNVETIEAELDTDNATGVNSLADELPDIDTYDFLVSGNGDIDIEIFSSTEKATDNETDRWLIDAAEEFNASNQKVDGKSVTVSVRGIASGTATDYIISGKYIPDAFTPANELWGEMVKSEGVELTEISKGLAGNTAGILLTEDKYKELEDNGTDITLKTVIEQTLSGNILLGYTNPYVSSAGLNILVSMLQTFDSSDIFSDASVSKLEELQANIPPVAYTTAQMRETATKGLLDAMVMEYQAYINTPELSSYKFVPFGVRHDSPLYSVGDISDEKSQGLALFAEYCSSEQAQKSASDYGFNGMPDYTVEANTLSGEDLFKAQQLWKEKKDAGQPVVAVFVADTSGSMEGTPITELQTSLINASNYIGEKNYIGLVTYSHDVFVNLEVEEFNNKQKAKFTGAVKSLSAVGGTATYDAVLVACDMLLQAKENIPNAKLMIFVLSDGEQTDGYNYSKVKDTLQGLRIPIHSICYGESLDEMEAMSSLNEASVIKAEPEDVVYNLKNVFNSQL